MHLLSTCESRWGCRARAVLPRYRPAVVTGELRSKVDRVWDAFWSGGISNPLEVIEQITYLLFIRRLDELQTLAENKANRTGRPVERVIFTGLTDRRRWKNFTDVGPAEMFETVADEVFPFLRTVGGEGSTYSQYMKDARFTVPSPALLSRVVDLLDDIPMVDRDTNGDLYEYMLGKIATAGQNGQLRTPRHIIALMVELMAPTARDEICDPPCVLGIEEFHRLSGSGTDFNEYLRGGPRVGMTIARSGALPREVDLSDA